MRRRSNLHRLSRNVDVRELLELVIHARKFFSDVFRRIRDFRFDPGDVEKNSTVRAATPLTYFPHDASRDVIARQELRRPARILVALNVSPSLFFVVRRLTAIVLRNVVEHEASSFAINDY